MAIRLSPALSVLISISLILTSAVKCSPAKNVVSMKKDVGVVEFDWRDKGVISPVYNQGMLGDVMDYVITEGVESLHAIESQTSVTLLSVQETAACCNDASHQASFDCITRIGGLCTQQDYKTGQGCGNTTCTPVGKVGSTGHIPAGREDIMMEMILQTPLIVLVDASQRSFEIYSGGIYSDSHCSSTMLDFAMQLVGYGSDNGTDYWIVRNSWGVYWGEEGYMRIVRGKNMCGLATAAMYPIGYERYY